MVTFIPPYMGEEIKSNAEKKMYDVLQKLDMEDTYVLHSCRRSWNALRRFRMAEEKASITGSRHGSRCPVVAGPTRSP